MSCTVPGLFWMRPYLSCLVSFGLTSAGAKAQRSPRLAARAGPSEEGRSRITADAPFCTRRSTVARPKPDAPPVTRPTIPYTTHTHTQGQTRGRRGGEDRKQETQENLFRNWKWKKTRITEKGVGPGIFIHVITHVFLELKRWDNCLGNRQIPCMWKPTWQ